MKKNLKRFVGIALAILMANCVCEGIMTDCLSINVLAANIDTPTQTLKKGAKGEQVKILQRCLNQIMNAGLEIDGSFGPATLTAVKNFQAKYGLEVDGSVGPATRAKINELINPTPDPTPTVQSESTLSVSGVSAPSGELKIGRGFGIRGVVTSNYTITNITAQIKSGNTVVQTKSVNANSTSYDLRGEINNAMVFGRLPAANYTFIVTASDQKTTKKIIETTFSVVGNSNSNISNNSSGAHLNDKSNPFYPYYVGQCTWYAYGRAYQILGRKPNLSTKSAQYWYDYNKSNRIYSYGSTPRVNSIVCWKNNSGGHIAIVDKVYDDGTIYISEYWGSSDKKLHQRRINPATYKSSKYGTYSLQGYIYLN